MGVVWLQAGRRLPESILQPLLFAGLMALAQLLPGQSYLQVRGALIRDLAPEPCSCAGG